MEIKLEQKLKNFNGECYNDEAGKDITLRIVCREALVVKDQTDEKGVFERYNLAIKINQEESDTINLESNDIVLIKSLLAKRWPIIIAGQAMNMLEGK